jgi:hypothetical protein
MLSMLTSNDICVMYYDDAADYYEQKCDPEYEYCHDNQHRFFMIRDYAKWLYELHHIVRVWE